MHSYLQCIPAVCSAPVPPVPRCRPWCLRRPLTPPGRSWWTCFWPPAHGGVGQSLWWWPGKGLISKGHKYHTNKYHSKRVPKRDHVTVIYHGNRFLCIWDYNDCYPAPGSRGLYAGKEEGFNPPPPPFFFGSIFFFFFACLLACQRGLSFFLWGRKIKSRIPHPHWATFSGLAYGRGKKVLESPPPHLPWKVAYATVQLHTMFLTAPLWWGRTVSWW